MQGDLKEVDFEKYCKICKFEKLTEREEPCDSCLATGVNVDSHKPVCWKEK